MTEEELIEDAECIGGLEPDPTRPPFSERWSIVHSFRFPPQDFKMSLFLNKIITFSTPPYQIQIPSHFW